MQDQSTLLAGPLGPQVAREVLDMMSARQVHPSAENYAVWLAYRLGQNSALREALDARIESGEPFSEHFNAEVYERFFTAAGASTQIMLAGEKIARDLGEVLSFLKQAESKSGDYGRTLESAATNLNRGLSQEQIQTIVASLAAATLDMANHNRQLNEQLARSTREVTSLRSSLETVRIESLTDSLTGLSNRRMFDEALRLRLEEARSNQSDLCLMLCDIDYFKRFNDTWGHHTGDQILRFMASALQAHAQPDYLIARYGGEEFAMIMPRTSLQVATQIADALRKAIQAKRLRRRSTNEDLGQVTISAGVARLQPSDTSQGLVERADACLYASKRNGRNQVTSDATPVLYVA